ncbi:BZ3500_MvSof-1268-A1-R1_Chr1-3g02147 [Microbotryum saponariae]|uniref:BZ3500_MvSof-1268-A1-R1_Chr1-3g02147 protein n=1 Tax=Microbotryum saponariae TaxID=289078 RepID=A0A2X0KRG6_9BASI|nr:BZ3500_MvSof-1268-A1-R1_Chr1-3g02147 [Microbotryum saponariae]SCZ95507.1 BZ3501_MvSof-1269-A2-R1_Chr1-3g01750 [Microbotryum saponariae]
MQLRSFSFEFLHVSPVSITGLADLPATLSKNWCIETALPFPRDGARDRESRPGRRGALRSLLLQYYGTALKHLCSMLHLCNLNMHVCSPHHVTSLHFDLVLPGKLLLFRA